MDVGESASQTCHGILSRLNNIMSERREKRKRWVQRGEYAVEVEVEVVYFEDDSSEACLEPATVRWLDEVARKAEAGDVEYLQKVGRVFQAVTG
ncbi:MAG: hypothetical protein HYV60_08765 [Planctomycetia bacterium]|nr:hypothetical protein [Planctomycetia bacterium]